MAELALKNRPRMGVMFISGSASAANIPQKLGGLDALLPKPFTQRDLLQRVQTIFRNREFAVSA